MKHKITSRDGIFDGYGDAQEQDICANRHGGNAESVAANRGTNKERDTAMILRRLSILDFTCDEMEHYSNLSHQTCSARFSDLKRLGLIEPTTRRKTRSGRWAMAWRKVKK